MSGVTIHQKFCLKRAEDWSGVSEGACMSLGTHSQ